MMEELMALLKIVIRRLIIIYLGPLQLSRRLALYSKGLMLQYEEHFAVAVDIMKRSFPNSLGVIVDIGAFDGDSTMYLARRMRKNLVMAFEPNPTPFQRGVAFTKGYKNIEFFNLGFSDHQGKVKLQLTNNHVSSSLLPLRDTTETSPAGAIDVEVTTLDNFMANQDDILLLKLDVQGLELKILSRSVETLKKTKLVLIEMLNEEIYDGGCHYYEVDEFLRTHGFKMHSMITSYNHEGTKYFDSIYIRKIFLDRK